MSFEWDYVNVLTLLRLAGIPRYAAERARAPSADRHRRRGDLRQPEPLAPFADVDRRRRRRGAGALRSSRAFREATDRADLLALARTRARLLRAVASTSRNTPPTARLRGLRRRSGSRGAPLPVRKAAREDHRTRSIRRRPGIFTPETEFGSRFLVEVVRGCANLCRFCWAGYNYLPVRAFPTDRILELAPRRPASTASRVGLVSIALCDHPDIERILARLHEMGYAISPASLRLDDLTESIVRVLQRERRAQRSPSRRKPDPTGCAASSTRP